MADQVEELIREIAATHGIAVSRDDPILILQTINSRLMQDTAKAQQEMLDRFKEEVEAVALRWSDDAKAKAERVLNVALAASKEAMLRAMQAGAMENVEAMKAEINDAISQVYSHLHATKRLTVMNMTTVVITFLAAGILMFLVK